jgi:GNAT superfamily N-acetyltransferase
MTEDRGWSLSAYLPVDAGDSLELVRRIWGEIDAAQPAYLDWQYADNPAGPVIAALARETGSNQLIGQAVQIATRVALASEECRASICLSVATDTEWRGLGVFSALLNGASEMSGAAGMACTFAFPNPQSLPSFIKRAGYTDVGAVPLLLRPANVSRLLRKRLGRPTAALAAPLGVFWHTPRPSSPDPNIVIETVEKFDASFNELWRRLKTRHPVMIVRDAAYLNWRFGEAPTRRYVTFAARTAERLAGFIVLRTAPVGPFDAGLVIDFIVEDTPEGRAAGLRLIDRAFAHLRSLPLDLLGTLSLPHTLEYRLLREKGFWPCPKRLEPQPFRLVARPYDEPGRLATKLRNWFVTMGDYDAV